MEVPELPRYSGSGGCAQAMQTDAMHRDPARVRPLDMHAHGTKRGQRRQAVLAFQETG